MQSKKDHLEAVKCLLAYDVNVVAKTTDEKHLSQWTLLHIASSAGYLNLVKYLLENGADASEKGKYESTALHFASIQGHSEVIKCLLENGANVNARDFKKLTPLHYASQNGCYEAVKCLLENGADVNAKDYKERTPFDVAKEEDIRRLLTDLYKRKIRFETISTLEKIGEGAQGVVYKGIFNNEIVALKKFSPKEEANKFYFFLDHLNLINLSTKPNDYIAQF
ncbi:unnamed protein product [Enterobius vermicularis]|uniref:ANK_REP_REGION domain-containing protein n=1 Tax=Enterobius vermicularis TaxID=51028 RepID=A0A0N4UY25_ENTVE|nr:unnamed protein product [Enterobius vermicularis]